MFDCLAHPDLVKNVTPDDWDEQRIMGEIQDALDRIAATEIAMELNTSGINKVIEEMNPFPAMLREMCERKIPIVIGADAHVPERVGDGYQVALQLLESVGYTQVSLFTRRERHDLAICDVRESLTANAVARS